MEVKISLEVFSIIMRPNEGVRVTDKKDIECIVLHNAVMSKSDNSWGKLKDICKKINLSNQEVVIFRSEGQK